MKKLCRKEKGGGTKMNIKIQWMVGLVRGYEGEFEYNAETHELRAMWVWRRLINVHYANKEHHTTKYHDTYLQ